MDTAIFFSVMVLSSLAIFAMFFGINPFDIGRFSRSKKIKSLPYKSEKSDIHLIALTNKRLSQENKVYYEAVYRALKYLEPHESEEVIKILMESKTFKKAYDIERNEYVNEKNVHIDKDVYKSTIDTILNNLN